jgi:hypothetical protein
MKDPLIWPAAKAGFERTSTIFGWAFSIFLVQSLFFPSIMDTLKDTALLLTVLFAVLCLSDIYRAYRKAKKEA